MRTRWSRLLALTAALAAVLGGVWQRRLHPGAANGTLDADRPRPNRAKPESMTKAELYEEAKRLDIPGRSTMDKDALARAVQRARH